MTCSKGPGLELNPGSCGKDTWCSCSSRLPEMKAFICMQDKKGSLCSLEW